MSRWGIVTSVLAVAALTAGCGGAGKGHGASASPETPPAAAVPADPNKACSLLSNDSVGKAFSVDKVASEEKPPQTAPNGLLTHVCGYREEASNRPLGILTVTVTDSSVTPAQVATAWRTLPAAQPVSGVGDAAIYSVDQQKKVAMVAGSKPARGKTMAVIFTGPPRTSQQVLSDLVRQALNSL